MAERRAGKGVSKALDVSASNTASYSANAKVAENFVTGETTAFVRDSANLSAGTGGVSVSATDESSYTALSDDFSVNLNSFSGALSLTLGKASAINEINKDTTAQMLNSTVNGSTVVVEALSNSTLSATAKALAVDEGDQDLSVFTLNLAGTLSANEVLGNVAASIEGSNVTTTAGDVSVSAMNSSLIDATTEASSKASSAATFTGSASIAINAIGWDIDDLQNGTLDVELFEALIGSNDDINDAYTMTSTTSDALAYILDSAVDANGNVSVTALSNAQLNATVSNAAESTSSALYVPRPGPGVGAVDTSFAISGLISSNKISSSAKAYIQNSTTTLTVEADGNVEVRAEDNAGIFSNAKVVSSSITTSDGGVSVLEDAVSALVGADYITDGSEVTDTDGNTVTPTLVLKDRVHLSDDYVPMGSNADGVPGTTYEYLGTGNPDLLDEDFTDLDFWREITETQLFPEGNNLTSSDSVALGGLIVRNEVAGAVEAYISNVDVDAASGNVLVQAIENASIIATADSAASSSGGSVWGTGQSLTLNAIIATNLVLTDSRAYIEDSTIDSLDLTVDAMNTSSLDATNSSLTESGAFALGVTLAFNTIGYDSVDVLRSSVDALLGTEFAGQTPAAVEAYIVRSTVNATGDISVTADMTATLNARLDASATSAATAFFGASAVATSAVLASNMVATETRAYIDEVDTPTASGSVIVSANDEATVEAVTEMVTSATEMNDLGIGVLNDLVDTLLTEYDYSSESGSVALEFGHMVRLASGFAGDGTPTAIYRYMGDGETLNLGNRPYDTDFGLWQQIDESNVIPSGIASALQTGLGLSGGTTKSFICWSFAMMSRARLRRISTIQRSRPAATSR